MAVSASPNPLRDIVVTDEPCPITLPWEFDNDDDSPRTLAIIKKGQLLRECEFTVNAIFDIGTIVIGVTGTTNSVMTTLNLVGLPINTVVTIPALWIEMTEDTEIILTLTGNPTTGQLDGFFGVRDQFSRAK